MFRIINRGCTKSHFVSSRCAMAEDAAVPCFSITPFLNSYIRRSFHAAALQLHSITINSLTTLELWKPKNHNSLNPNLVLLHGFGPEAMWQWRKQLTHFSPHFNLYIPNLLFFGNSFTNSLHRSEAFQAECIAKLLMKLGVLTFSAIGTSYGGFVLYNLTKICPERVDKVVIASSALNMVKADNLETAKRANVENVQDLMLPSTARNFRKLATLIVYKFPKAIPDFILNDLLRNLYSRYRKEKMELLNGLTLVHNETPQVSPCKQDILLIWGDQDGIFPLRKGVELQKLLGDSVRLEVIKNAGHIPHMEKPDEFNRIVLKFLLG